MTCVAWNHASGGGTAGVVGPNAPSPFMFCTGSSDGIVRVWSAGERQTARAGTSSVDRHSLIGGGGGFAELSGLHHAGRRVSAGNITPPAAHPMDPGTSLNALLQQSLQHPQREGGQKLGAGVQSSDRAVGMDDDLYGGMSFAPSPWVSHPHGQRDDYVIHEEPYLDPDFYSSLSG